MRRDIDGSIKFGISVWPENRRRQIELEQRHGEVSIIWTHHCECMRAEELRIHKALKRWAVPTEREWFSVSESYAKSLLSFFQEGN
jgi:hypothetical protein